jgi:hypothetical protein
MSTIEAILALEQQETTGEQITSILSRGNLIEELEARGNGPEQQDVIFRIKQVLRQHRTETISVLRSINRAESLKPISDQFDLSKFPTNFSRHCVRFLIENGTIRSPIEVAEFYKALTWTGERATRDTILAYYLQNRTCTAIDGYNAIFNANGWSEYKQEHGIDGNFYDLSSDIIPETERPPRNNEDTVKDASEPSKQWKWLQELFAKLTKRK